MLPLAVVIYHYNISFHQFADGMQLYHLHQMPTIIFSYLLTLRHFKYYASVQLSTQVASVA